MQTAVHQTELPGIPVVEPGPHPGDFYTHQRKGYDVEVMAVVRAPAPGWVICRYPLPVSVPHTLGIETPFERRVFTLEEFQVEFQAVRS